MAKIKSTSPAPETTGAETLESSIISASAQVISTSEEVDENQGLEKVKISYPKDFKGVKYLEDGKEYHVSKETAEEFRKPGIIK